MIMATSKGSSEEEEEVIPFRRLILQSTFQEYLFHTCGWVMGMVENEKGTGLEKLRR